MEARPAERGSGQARRSIALSIKGQRSKQEAILLSLSGTGALIETEERLTTGEEILFHFRQGVEIAARVIQRSQEGAYAVELARSPGDAYTLGPGKN